MGLLVPHFDGTPIVIGNALAPTGSAVNTSILPMAAPDNGSPGYDGVVLDFEVTQSGGTTAADVQVDIYRSPDGTNVDSEKIGTVTIDSSVTDTSGTHRKSILLRTIDYVPGGDSAALIPGAGWAIRCALTRTVGNRTMAVTVRARRFRMGHTEG